MSNPETSIPNENIDDLKDRARDAKEEFKDLAGDAGRFARDRMSDVKKSVSAAVDTVKTKAKAANENIVTFVKDNPWRSLAIAAGIGLALGFLLRRR
jgi:ElaB/YqjD/DUF883 family membrane-anchored ribosome-binding protein